MRSIIAVTLAALFASAANANMIVNGDFEQPLGGEWTRSGNLNRSSAVAFYQPSEGAWGILWNSGENTPNGSLSQNVITTAGGLYRLEFDFGKYFSGAGTASLLVTVNSITNKVLLNTTVADSTGATGPDIHDPFAFEFTADSTLIALSFRDTTVGGSSFDAALDNVRLTLVPEPSAVGVLALAGMAAARRRR